MIGKIDEKGALWIKRKYFGWVEQSCKYEGNSFCGIHCPAFEEPQRNMEGTLTILSICDGKVLRFKSFHYEKKGGNNEV